MYKKIYVIILILILFYLYNNLYNTYLNRENFYTFFLPFYEYEIPDKKNIYNTKISNLNYLKNEFIYRPLKFGLVLFDMNEDNSNIKFINNIIKILLKSTNILNIELVYLKNMEIASKMLNNNKLDILYCTTPILNSLINNKLSIENIDYICSLNFEYMYLISNTMNRYNNIKDIKGKKIGILNINNSTFIKYKIILDELTVVLGYKEGTDYEIEYSSTINNLMFKLDNKLIDFIFYTDSYPSADLNRIFKNDIYNKYFIIPINVNNKLLSSTIRYYVPSTVDLNFIENYLPKKIGNTTQTRNKPNIETYKYQNVICCTKNLNKKIGYEITKAIYNNINIINKNNIDSNTRMYKYNMIGSPMSIKYNQGAFDFYIEKGFITYNPRKECKYLVGNKKCTDNILMNMKLI